MAQLDPQALKARMLELFAERYAAEDAVREKWKAEAAEIHQKLAAAVPPEPTAEEIAAAAEHDRVFVDALTEAVLADVRAKFAAGLDADFFNGGRLPLPVVPGELPFRPSYGDRDRFDKFNRDAYRANPTGQRVNFTAWVWAPALLRQRMQKVQNRVNETLLPSTNDVMFFVDKQDDEVVAAASWHVIPTWRSPV